MGQEESALKKVSDFYESKISHMWDIIANGHIHLGYWDDQNRDADFSGGTEKLTRLMIEKAEISSGQRFCDIGCGVGKPAIMLAGAKGCFVDGITISEYQQKEAGKRAEEEGVEDKTRFFTANALDLPFADDTYDGGWFFESIFHMGHHGALCEAHRVLKPGAVLVICDIVDIGIMTVEEKRLVKNLGAVYAKAEEYPDLLTGAGLDLIEISEITREVMGPFASKSAEAIRAHKSELLKIAPGELVSEFEKICERMSKTAGYVILKAKNRDK